MNTKFIACVFLFSAVYCLLCSSAVYAACTGSGTVWSCPAGASVSDVQAAIDSASDGAIITFAAGSYTWGSPAAFSLSKGATLICASVGACTVNTGGATVLGTPIYSGTNTHLYRISGFTFNQSAAASVIWFGYSCPCTGIFTQVRIDHNTFNLVSMGVAVFFGENGSVTNAYGVVDHNTILSPGNAAILMTIGAVNPSPPPSPLGTGNNMFIEDNTITITMMDNAGEGCMDSWGGDAIVWRHNTSINCLVTAHGSLHAGGPQNIEVYNNSMKVDAGSVGQGEQDGYRLFHHQGSGEFIAFNNAFLAYSGRSTDVIAMMYYRDEATLAASEGGTACDGTVTTLFADGKTDGNRTPTATYAGYPCWHQPGRDFGANLKPMYAWGNKWSDTGAKIDLTLENYGGFYAQHFVADRDYFNAVGDVQTSPTSPFNGTTGMGYGTLANRPTACSVGLTDAPDAGHGGVGYFATDVGPQGTLYTCSATNTWTVYYAPYTYPHPLVSGTPPPPADTIPPTVAITSPANGAMVSGTISVAGTAADNVAVANVQVSIDGGAYSAASGTANWTFSLNTTTLSNAPHMISAKATDTSGNVSTIASISMTVSNGSGHIINATSCSQTDVQAAINSANNGDTVNVPVGSCTWSSNVQIANKNIIVMGAGAASTVINGATFDLVVSAARVSGFTFNMNNAIMNIDSSIGFRVDHCTFTEPTWTWCITTYGNGAAPQPIEGLLDHDMLTRCRVANFGEPYGSTGQGSDRWAEPLNIGTSHALYVEDSTFNLPDPAGPTGQYANGIDGNLGSRTVIRFNSFPGSRIEQHGLQGDNERAVRLWEIYNNNLMGTNGPSSNYRPFLIRGGTGLIFHNTSDGTYSVNYVDIDNDRSHEASIASQLPVYGFCDGTRFPDGNANPPIGWPCRDQIGRSTDASYWNHLNPAPPQTSQPAYIWGNTQPGGEIPWELNWDPSDNTPNGNINQALQIVESRDFYVYRSTFNGTVGVGEGTLAQRPATCTKGVGYWATDQGNWNQSGKGGQGVLYACTAPNTWALYYTPYTYPHPLQGGTLPPTDTIPPSVPTNLAAVAVSSSQINLNWTASTDNVGVTGYKVFRCQGAGCTPSAQVATTASTSLLDAGLTASTTYVYKISAFDAAGNVSALSASASAVTLSSSSVSSNLPPVVSPIGTNATDVDPATPGLQIYDNTSVTYTGTASDPNGGTITWQWLYTTNGGAPVLMASGTGTVQPFTFNYPAGIAPKTYVWILSASNGVSTVQQTLTVNVIVRPSNPPPTPTPADPTPGLKKALVYPNPVVKADPTIRAMVGMVDSVEVTIFDVSEHVVHSGSVSGAPTGILNGQYYYDYKWTGSKASGTYFAVIHGKAADGTIVRARVKFIVVN